jgi:hypothetical protein
MIGKEEGRLLLIKPEEKILHGGSNCRWVDNINMDIAWSGMGWTGLTQDRRRWRSHVNTVMNLWVPEEARKLP